MRCRVAASDTDSFVREDSYPGYRPADVCISRYKRQRDRCKLCQAACKSIAARTEVARARRKPAYATGLFPELATVGVACTEASPGGTS